MWWAIQAKDRVFGTPTNWTKWHRAGEAIENIHARFRDYIDNLPMNRDALYEIAMLQGDELRLCLENKYTRSSKTAGCGATIELDNKEVVLVRS